MGVKLLACPGHTHVSGWPDWTISVTHILWAVTTGQTVDRTRWIYQAVSKYCQPPFPILRQFDPVRTLTSYFLKIHLNIFLPSTPGSPQWSFYPGLPTKTLYTPLPSPYVLHSPPILFSILSPAQYWVRSKLSYLAYPKFIHSFLSPYLSERSVTWSW